MAYVDLVFVGATGVVFDNTEVILPVVFRGYSGEFLEFGGASLLGLPLADLIGNKTASVLWGFRSCFSAIFRWARVNARKLEGILDRLTFVAAVATLRDFRVVTIFKEGRRVGGTIGDPDVHNGNLRVAHALSDKFDGDLVFDVLFFQTFSLSESSRMVLGKDTRNDLSKGILDLECNVRLVLHVNLDREFRVHC